MDVKMLDAVSAYAKAAKSATFSAGGGEGASSVAGGGFGDVLKGFMNDGVSAVKEGEKASMLAVGKKNDLVDVVTAISNAEVMLDTVTTVRDKVISAYQEIIKMPI